MRLRISINAQATTTSDFLASLTLNVRLNFIWTLQFPSKKEFLKITYFCCHVMMIHWWWSCRCNNNNKQQFLQTHIEGQIKQKKTSITLSLKPPPGNHIKIWSVVQIKVFIALKIAKHRRQCHVVAQNLKLLSWMRFGFSKK